MLHPPRVRDIELRVPRRTRLDVKPRLSIPPRENPRGRQIADEGAERIAAWFQRKRGAGELDDAAGRLQIERVTVLAGARRRDTRLAVGGVVAQLEFDVRYRPCDGVAQGK